MDLTAFTDAAGDVVTAITTDVLPAMIGVAIAALGVSLAVGWVRRIRSAV